MRTYKGMAVLLLSAISFTTFLLAQNSPVVSNVHFTDAAGAQIDANGLQEGQQLRFNFTIRNVNLKEEVAAGLFEIRIDVGNNAAFISEKDFKDLPFAEYIVWSFDKTENQIKHFAGKIIKPLPARFTGKMVFNLRCNSSGSSVAKAGIYKDDKLTGNTDSQAFFTIIHK